MNAYKDSEHSGSGGGGTRPVSRRASSVTATPAAGRSAAGVLRSSRRVRLVAGIALVVVCALAVPMLAAQASAKPSRVLAAAQDLPAGTALTSADVLSVQASGPTGAIIPAAGLAGLVGRTLRVEVPAGALLDAADLGAFPPSGTSVVPVSVKAGQYPADLVTGQQVAIFPQAGQDAASPGSPAAHAAATGLVLQIAPVANDQSGTVVIDLQVPLDAAPVVAQAPGVVLVGLDTAGDAP
jgi:flagella basal body P-ring formation protein FlgA